MTQKRPTHVNRLMLERYAIGELHSEQLHAVSQQIAQDHAAQEIVAEIEDARETIRLDIPKKPLLDMMCDAQEGTLAKKVNRWRLPWTRLLPAVVGGLLAAVLFIHLLTTSFTPSLSPALPTNVQIDPTQLIIRVERHSPEKPPRSIFQHAELQSGEHLQLIYTAKANTPEYNTLALVGFLNNPTAPAVRALYELNTLSKTKSIRLPTLDRGQTARIFLILTTQLPTRRLRGDIDRVSQSIVGDLQIPDTVKETWSIQMIDVVQR